MGGEKIHADGVAEGLQGSPPRGRGKAPLIKILGTWYGITPAWAGKSISQTSTMKAERDHPRVGGEKQYLSSKVLGILGSPPRGRGKGGKDKEGENKLRITPAWAGKSSFVAFSCVRCRDHPRVGGEKPIGHVVSSKGEGSPPRGRGKGQHALAPAHQVGITPAWAGKSRNTRPPNAKAEDHPRVGGEKRPMTLKKMRSWGSPPRGRGKASWSAGSLRSIGITPAWAGKSASLRDL